MRKTTVAAVCAAVASAALCAAPEPTIKATAVGGVFVAGETPCVRLRDAKGSVSWTLRDWRRVELRRGRWPEGGLLRFNGLGRGYYYLDADGESGRLRGCTFCVVADPSRRQFPADSFYGVDAALSWVSAPRNYAVNWYGDNSYRATLDLIRLCGLPNVRERMTWGEVSKEPGKYSWGKYLENAKFAVERGITLSGVFHDAPKYAKRDGKGPVDPGAVYRFCRDASKAFGHAMGDWEFWNEPDISFWPDPAWDFAAASKAAFLGFRAGCPGMVVLNGAMAYTTKGSMSDVLFSNDLAKYTNVLNCHAYGPPARWDEYFAELRAFMKRFGLEGRQVWFTESSTNMEGESEGDGLTPGFKAHSHAQELVLAELYAKNSTYMQMQGLAHNYFFVFGAYNERNGTKDWGVQRRDGSVKPVYAAIATTTEHLVAARLEGEMSVGEGVKCFLFRQPDGAQSIVFWSVSPIDVEKGAMVNVTDRQMQEIDREFSICAKDGRYSLANWCGQPGRAEAKGGRLSLKASRYATFVDGLSSLKADRVPHPVGRVAEYVPSSDEDLSVVVAIDFAKSDFTTTKCEAGVEGDTGRVTIRQWNFSDRAKSGRVVIENGILEGMPPSIDLPPNGDEVAFDAVLRLTDLSSQVVKLTICGVFDGRRTSRLFVPVRSDKVLIESRDVVEFDSNKPEFWVRNDSASTTRISWDEEEKAVRFDLEWKDPKVDRWFYPKHILKGGDDSLSGATHLDCEVRMVSNKMENDVLCSHCMLFSPGGGQRYCDFLPPTDFWERRRIALTDADGACLGEKCESFGLGFNPFATKVTFWVRNVRAFRRKTKLRLYGSSASLREVHYVCKNADALK